MSRNDSKTNLSLVQRLKDRDQSAWEHFESFYGPIIFRFAISQGLSHDLAEEVRSNSYLAVVNQIKSFEYDQSRGRFRNWLLTIASRRISDLSRKNVGLQADTQVLESIEANEQSPQEIWEAQWKQQILAEAYARVERRIGEQSRIVFQRIVQSSESAKKIASDLGIGENQIYKTKQRCVQMLREEIRFLEHDPLTAG